MTTTPPPHDACNCLGCYERGHDEAQGTHASPPRDADSVMVPQFRKRPLVVEAVQVSKHMGLDPQWFADAVTANQIHTFGLGKFGEGRVHCIINTPEGAMEASDGDWIIRGVRGEFYPCKPGIFAATYDPVSETPPAPDAHGTECFAAGLAHGRAEASAYESDALRLAREAVDAMDAAELAIVAAWGTPGQVEADDALQGATADACDACIAYVRALPSGAAVQGEAVGREAEPMKRNKFHQRGGWMLHDCPDGEPCSADIGGGCATGYCGRLSVAPDDAGVPRYPATPLAKSDGAEDPELIARQEEAAWQAYSTRLDTGAKSMASAPREVIGELLKAARAVR